MATFKEADQVRLMLKMKLSNYSWYASSIVIPDSDGFAVVIGVRRVDNQIRKIISPVLMGVSVRTEVET